MSRFKDWQATSLFRRTVVTVASFTMLACVSIATMSFVAVSATKAVFKPTADAAPSAAPVPEGTTLQAANGPRGKSAKPAGAKTPGLNAGAD